MSNAVHFARLIAGRHCLLDEALGVPSPCEPRSLAGRGLHSSAAVRGPGSSVLPTLGNTSIKLNSSRWSNASAETGMSVFDVKGAMECLRKGPDEAGHRRVHPAAIAHAERIARAQNMGTTIMGFKVFPNLTPARAFMWGSILALYAVGTTSYVVARSLEIESVDDIKVKMQAWFAPYKASLTEAAKATRSVVELERNPDSLSQLQAFGRSLNRSFGGKKDRDELHH